MTTLSIYKMDTLNDIDMDFAKRAARGITIVSARVDSGVGYHAPEFIATRDNRILRKLIRAQAQSLVVVIGTAIWDDSSDPQGRKVADNKTC